MAATVFDALHPRIQSGLRELGISEPTPPQEKAIGPISQGKSARAKSRKTADMVLSYGRKAVEALMVRGVGPVTSYQVLSRMHRDEKKLYSDLLKAKIQYMKTRQYWDNK